MVRYWNWNRISLKNLRVKIEIIGPENCFPLYRGLHEVLQKWALLQRDHVKWSCDWSGWIKILNREATRRVKEQKIRTHRINSSIHCTVPITTTFSDFSYFILHKPCKIAKMSEGTGPYATLCKSYTTHYTWSILQCCRLQYYAGQVSSSAAALELLTDSPGNECCVVSDVMQVQSHADLIIL